MPYWYIALLVLIVGAKTMPREQKIRPIFLLSKGNELGKFLHGKTQITNESFNVISWEGIPKNTFVTLPNLEFGVYDTVANFNVGMKASVLFYENLILFLVYTCRELAKNAI